MVPLTALWLPILVAAVIVFIASSIIHMAPLWHRTDYPAVPNQDQVMDALRPMNIPPGDYMIPRARDMAQMKTPEFTEKLKRGPVLIMTVMDEFAFTMGRTLTLWFLYCVVVSFFAAYITGRALGPGTDYLEVFRFAGATAFIGYACALWPISIWYKRAWSLTIKGTVDGFIYGLLTAGTFGWLWPQ